MAALLDVAFISAQLTALDSLVSHNDPLNYSGHNGFFIKGFPKIQLWFQILR